ncbi:MAG TPA: hypothetical protein PLF54_10405 [Deltaproteobacteria bacterium]|nr:hypothetical protein [Deltaproteobacteria bacterium]
MIAMKKILAVLFALMVFSPACSGQDVVPAARKGKAHPPVSHKAAASAEIKGKIETITLADPSRGVRPELSVMDEAGKRYTFLVRPTTIYGSDWKVITLDKLLRDQQVRVRYTASKEGFFTALSIKSATDGKDKPL